MLGYWPYATHKKTFFKTKTTSIAIKYKNHNKKLTNHRIYSKIYKKLKAKKKNHNWREIKHVHEGAKIMKPEFSDSVHPP
jgi:hypothetical protein